MTVHVAPIAASERIDSLDVLRGFALLGILLINIGAFSLPLDAFFNPTLYGDFTGANYAVWFLCRLFADQKFMTIFSMLFGAGIIVFTTRAQERGDSAAALHYRRSMWLLLIGLLHAYLVWAGDILATYAMCAFLVYPARNLSPKKLVTIGLILLSVSSLIMLGASLSQSSAQQEAPAESLEGAPPQTERIANELAAYRGGWMEQQPFRAELALEFQVMGFLVWVLWRAGGLMLIGMALYKWGVFSATHPRAFYAKMVVIGLLAGVPISFLGIYLTEASQWDARFVEFDAEQFNYWGSLGVSAAYVGLVMLFCQSGAAAWLKHALRSVGQMAFTNYLMQSVICTTIFYGHGLGYFGHFSRVEMLLTVIAVWIAQLIYSPLWLARFQYGPFEWLWRSLTYWKMQPMLRPQVR